MTDKTPETPEPFEKKGEGDSIYDQLAQVDEPKDVEIPEEDDDLTEHKTLSERQEETPNLGDTQALLKQLYPDTGIPMLTSLEVARIFPDVYEPLQRILVKHLIKSAKREGKTLWCAEAICLVNTPESIGIDGEGRIDALGVAGVVAEEKKLEKEAEAVGGI